MKKKNMFAATLALLVVFALMGCSSPAATKESAAEPDDTQAAEEADQSYKIGYSNMDSNNPHFVNWGEGIRNGLESLGHTVVEIDAKNDGSKQISDVEDMIAQQCDVIMIAPVDSKGVKTALVACQDADIPAFILDIPAEDTDLVTCTVATDNFSAGKLLAEKMVEETGGTAAIAIIDYSVSEAVRARMDGFYSVITKEDYPDMVVVEQQDCLPTVEDALPLVENYLQSHPDITDIYAFNDLTAQGALNACTGAGRDDIRIYGIDGSQDGIRLASEGKIVGTSAQFPVTMGEKAAEAALKLLNGETIDKEILVESLFIDKELAPDYLED